MGPFATTRLAILAMRVDPPQRFAVHFRSDSPLVACQSQMSLTLYALEEASACQLYSPNGAAHEEWSLRFYESRCFTA